MKQITLTKNEGIGWTVWFIVEDEEMSHASFDVEQDAIERFKELAAIL
jgi:hypothetical protein